MVGATAMSAARRRRAREKTDTKFKFKFSIILLNLGDRILRTGIPSRNLIY
eukprot:SAG31_NODE_1390_length_8539_cov_12.684834_10_plen_51_part_00